MKTVTIYTTPTCAYCRMAKEYFKKHDIAYTEHDVALDIEARKTMLEKSGQLGVPVITIDKEVIIGFDEKRIRALLGI